MDLTNTVTMDADEAAAKAVEYRELKAPTDEDLRIAAIFTALASGKQVIDLHRAVIDAGCDDAGRPRLAAMRATHPWCYLYGGSEWDHSGRSNYLDFRSSSSGRRSVDTISMERPESFEPAYGRLRSQVPVVPPQHRRRGWKSMVVLWEVEEWAKSPRPPGDPILERLVLGQRP
jgi:hypothetical protein